MTSGTFSTSLEPICTSFLGGLHSHKQAEGFPDNKNLGMIQEDVPVDWKLSEVGIVHSEAERGEPPKFASSLKVTWSMPWDEDGLLCAKKGQKITGPQSRMV